MRKQANGVGKCSRCGREFAKVIGYCQSDTVCGVCLERDRAKGEKK